MSPIASNPPCTTSVMASASMPPNTAYRMVNPAATAMDNSALSALEDVVLSTCPKARICAAAQMMELGMRIAAASRSVPTLKRSR